MVKIYNNKLMVKLVKLKILLENKCKNFFLNHWIIKKIIDDILIFIIFTILVIISCLLNHIQTTITQILKEKMQILFCEILFIKFKFFSTKTISSKIYLNNSCNFLINPLIFILNSNRLIFLSSTVKFKKEWMLATKKRLILTHEQRQCKKFLHPINSLPFFSQK